MNSQNSRTHALASILAKAFKDTMLRYGLEQQFDDALKSALMDTDIDELEWYKELDQQSQTNIINLMGGTLMGMAAEMTYGPMSQFLGVVVLNDQLDDQ